MNTIQLMWNNSTIEVTYEVDNSMKNGVQVFSVGEPGGVIDWSNFIGEDCLEQIEALVFKQRRQEHIDGMWDLERAARMVA